MATAAKHIIPCKVLILGKGGAMEGVEGQMGNLKLLAVEKKWLCIGSTGKAAEAKGGQAQVLGKVLSKKLIHAETVE
jgi:hypothetical protein